MIFGKKSKPIQRSHEIADFKKDFDLIKTVFSKKNEFSYQFKPRENQMFYKEVLSFNLIKVQYPTFVRDKLIYKYEYDIVVSVSKTVKNHRRLVSDFQSYIKKYKLFKGYKATMKKKNIKSVAYIINFKKGR